MNYEISTEDKEKLMTLIDETLPPHPLGNHPANEIQRALGHLMSARAKVRALFLHVPEQTEDAQRFLMASEGCARVLERMYRRALGEATP